MTGHELLGMAMEGKIKEFDVYRCVEKPDFKIYLAEYTGDLCFMVYSDIRSIWGVNELKAKFEKVEKKPELNDWEKELLRKAKEYGYTHVLFKKNIVWITDSAESGNRNEASGLHFGLNNLRNDKYEGEEISIEWLLGRE